VSRAVPKLCFRPVEMFAPPVYRRSVVMRADEQFGDGPADTERPTRFPAHPGSFAGRRFTSGFQTRTNARLGSRRFMCANFPLAPLEFLIANENIRTPLNPPRISYFTFSNREFSGPRRALLAGVGISRKTDDGVLVYPERPGARFFSCFVRTGRQISPSSRTQMRANGSTIRTDGIDSARPWT
jgi:hypothetical protein